MGASESLIWPDEAYEAAASAVGRACGLLLLTEHRWTHRRVETIDLLSTELVRRSTSVDFTVPQPIRPMLAVAGAQPVVPLATLSKQPLRHFDLRDEGGKALPVLGQAQNGAVAHQAVRGIAELAVASAGLSPLTEQTSTYLKTIAVSDASEAHSTTDTLLRAAREGNAELQAVFEDDWTYFLLTLVSDNYVLLGATQDLDTRRVVKFAYDEALEDSRGFGQRLAQGLGVQPLTFEIDTPAAGRAASYHLEIVIPEELRLEKAILYDRDTLEVYAEDEDADRGSLHAAGLDPSTRAAVYLLIRAERAGLATIAFVISLVTAGILLFGAVVREPDPKTGGPPIAVLLAVSALFAGAVAQRSEHILVQRFFTPHRVLLTLGAVAALGAGAVLAFGAGANTIDVVWKVSAGVAVVVASMLGYAFKTAVPMTKSRKEGV